MQAKTLKTLGFVTLVVAVAAGVVSTTNRGGTSEAAENETGPLFPGLRDRINDVARIEVANKDGAFTVAREDGRWGIPDKGGFPVDFTKVKEVVLAVSKLEKVEKKTRNPELYSRLGVEDVSAADAQSTQVVLKDESGAELAAVLVGNTHQRPAGGGDPNIYARKVGDEQSWQCAGRVWVDTTETNWLQKEIVAIGQERIRGATTTHPDGETLHVAKEAPEDAHWAVADLPEDRELTWDGAADAIARAAQRLMLQDVQPADEVELDESSAVVTEFTTFDGLVLTMQVYDQGEDSLVRLSAALDASLRADQAPGPPVPDDAEGEDGAEDEEAGPEPESAIGKSLEEVEQEVLELNERFADWVYTVPSYTAANLRKRVDDLLKPLESETPDAGVAGTPGAPGEAQTLDELFPDGLPPEIQQAIDQAEAAEGTPEAAGSEATETGEGDLSDTTTGAEDAPADAGTEDDAPTTDPPAEESGEDGR